MTILMIGFVAASLFFAQKYLYRHFWNKAVNVSIQFADDTVQVGEQTTLTEVVENAKLLPLPVLKVKFQCSNQLKFASDQSSQVTDLYYRTDLFSLKPYRRITRKHQVVCSQRGYYDIRGIDLVGATLFLEQEMLEHRAGETWLHVIPALVDVEEIEARLQEISGATTQRRRLMTDPFAFRGIREYTPFDELKTVNWKASAKSEELKVNVYEYSAVNAVSLFINLTDRQLSGSAEQIERAISIAYSLAERYLTRGVNISLYANGLDCLQGNILWMEEYHDRRQLEQIGKMLARLDLKRDAPPFASFEERIKEQAERMVIIISPDWLDEFQELLGRLNENHDLTWLCPCRKEDEVKIRPALQARAVLLPNVV
jgi:uncharacterized protein (DUF58 family)